MTIRASHVFMRTASVLAALTFLTIRPASGAPQAGPLSVVELYQSQGCSSCPPANANAIALSDRPDLLVLSFGVTYWDQLGWKDTFASPQFTARQWAYAHALRHSEVFTPQVIVNGRADVVGDRRDQLEALIRRSGPLAGPAITATGGRVTIGEGAAAHPAEVYLVRYDPNIVQVPIQRGENEGKTLPHKNVVKALVKIGVWNGRAAAFALPASPAPGLRAAILLQDGSGGPILSAARL